MLYHVAGFIPENTSSIVEVVPGTQNSAGIGVYFSETPIFMYAGGERTGGKWDHQFYVIFEVSEERSRLLLSLAASLPFSPWTMVSVRIVPWCSLLED